MLTMTRMSGLKGLTDGSQTYTKIAALVKGNIDKNGNESRESVRNNNEVKRNKETIEIG